MRNIGSRKAFNAWAEMATEVADAKRQLMAAANSMRNIGSRKAFNAWHEMATEVADAKRQLMAAANSMRNIGSRKAFNAWHEMATEAAEAKRQLMSAANSMRNVGSRKAFNQWAEMASERRAALYAMSGALTSMRSIGLRKGFMSWASILMEQARTHELMASCAAAFRNQGLRRALSSWMQNAHRRAAHQIRRRSQKALDDVANARSKASKAIDERDRAIADLTEATDDRDGALREAQELRKLLQVAREESDELRRRATLTAEKEAAERSAANTEVSYLRRQAKVAEEKASGAVEAAEAETKAVRVQLAASENDVGRLLSQVAKATSESRKAIAEATEAAVSAESKTGQQLRMVANEATVLRMRFEEKCASLREAKAEVATLQDQMDKACRCWIRERSALEAAHTESDRQAAELQGARKQLEEQLIQITCERNRAIEAKEAVEKESQAVLESARARHASACEAYAVELREAKLNLVKQASASASEKANIKDQAQQALKLTGEARRADEKQREELFIALRDAESTRDGALMARDSALAESALAREAMANKDEVWENAQRSLASLPRRIKDDHLVIREVLASEGAWRSTGVGVTQRRQAAAEGLTKTQGMLHDWKAEARQRFLQNVASTHELSPVPLIKPALAIT
jgi:hypothetical protein